MEAGEVGEGAHASRIERTLAGADTLLPLPRQGVRGPCRIGTFDLGLGFGSATD